VGHSKGGLNTKIHAIVDGLGNPVDFLLSPGNDHDSSHAIELLSRVDISGCNVLGDKAYGAKAIRDFISEHGATYDIPPHSNAKEPWHYDRHTYKERHLVECFFQRLKWFRRIATRYDKSDDSFFAFIFLAAITILLK
jgi:Transposase and inactivated derivatives